MNVKVAELRGFKAWRAFNAFHTLMLGLKMLPSYMTKTYEEFFEATDVLPIEEKTKLIREALLFVELQREEVETVISFCTDPNGVPYSAENTKNLGPDQIFEMLSAVFTEIAKIKITLVSGAEKKN